MTAQGTRDGYRTVVRSDLTRIRSLRLRLDWSQNRQNRTVWTDSRQRSRCQPHYCLCQRLHWYRYDWNFVSQQRSTVWRQQSGFVWSRQSDQITAEVYVGFECCWNGQNISNRTFRNMTPLWEQRDKIYRNRDLKPKLWNETGEKINVVNKYWNNNTNEIG